MAAFRSRLETPLDAGADICLPAHIGANEFRCALIRLANDKLVAVSDIPKPKARRPSTWSSLKSASMPVEPCWTLIDDCWVLCTPQGIGLCLTEMERDLLINVFRAGNKTVYHAQWDRRHGRITRERRDKVSALSVLVGHFRRKCAALDIDFPLYVKRGGGYRFVEACFIGQGKVCDSSLQGLSHQDALHEYDEWPDHLLFNQ